MAARIDEVLDFLALDERLHSIEEIIDALDISRHTCSVVADFLAKYDFIQFEGSKVKINPRIRNFVIASSEEMSILRGLPSLAIASSLQEKG